MNSGKFQVATNNSNIFIDSIKNDIIIRSVNSTQNVLFGAGENVKSTLIINSNSVGIGTNLPIEVLDVRGNISVSQNQYILGNVGIGTTDTRNKKLYIAGDMEASGLIRTSNLVIEGDLTVVGNQTLINTDVKVTDQFVISNLGTGPALQVFQYGNNTILEAYDDDNIAFIVANNANIGIRTSVPNGAFHVYGNSLLEGFTTVKSNLTVNSNLFVNNNIQCQYINNVLLNYDVPDVSIIETTINSSYIHLHLSLPVQDNDGFGNLIPNIDTLNISFSNLLLGNTIKIVSNNTTTAGKINYVNIFSGSNIDTYSTTNITNDTFNIYGLVSQSNYDINLYYKNARNKSVNNTIINSISTQQIGYPTSVLNLTTNIMSSNLNISYNTPLYLDKINNANNTSIKEYYLFYQAISSIKYGGVSHCNLLPIVSSSNNISILNYRNELYDGTLYKFNVYSKNKSIDLYSDVATTYFYTDINSNNYNVGCNLNDLNFSDQSNVPFKYNYNTFYAIDGGSNGPITSFISNSNTLLLYNTSAFSKSLTTSNLRLFYNPNPRASNVGLITSTLNFSNKTTTTVLDTVAININNVESLGTSPSNSTYISLQLDSLNTDMSKSIMGIDKLSNYFVTTKLISTINYNSKALFGYNKYNLNTTVNLKNYNGWNLTSQSNLSFDSNLLSSFSNGNINFNYYFDDINLFGTPIVNNFGYTLSNNKVNYVSGIPSISNYNLDYAVIIDKVASYWSVNPIVTLSNIQQSLSINLTTSNKYYYTSNSNNSYNSTNYVNTKSYITEINKATLSNGLQPYNYKILFKESSDIYLTSNILRDIIPLSITGYSIVGSNTSNINIGPVHYDSNSINHPHILIKDSNNIYGIRMFPNVLNINTYPTIDLITTYDNSSNISIGNYSKEAVLYNGYYYGENNNTWKYNWITINNLSFDYSTIGSTNTRYSLFKYGNINGISTSLCVNIQENNYDDKLILVKYIDTDTSFESVWFSISSSYNGQTLYTNRINGDGIKDTSKIDTQYQKYIKCPGKEQLTMFIIVGIPVVNINSRFKSIYITQT